MKIVQILPNLDVGGMERMAMAMARQQKTEGHEPLLYCTTHPGAMADQAKAMQVPVVAFEKRPGFSIALVQSIARRLRADRPDIVHTHNALVHHYGVIAAKLAGVPVVVNTRHGYGSFGWDAKREAIFNTMATWTDAVVMVTRGVQDYFVTEQGIAKQRTHVIMNGADLDEFLSRRAQPGSHKPVIRFGTVGRLSAPKNHVLLVRAFAKVLSDLPGAELHILGDGECRGEIESCIAELGLERSVTLHGFSSDVPGFLSKLDVFVLASLSEGLPLAVIEAMAAGLPIVSTHLPGVEDVAPEGTVAWYCESGNRDELAAAMLSAARHPNLASIGEAASTLAKNHSTAQMWHEYQHLFEKLLQAKAGRLALAS